MACRRVGARRGRAPLDDRPGGEGEGSKRSESSGGGGDKSSHGMAWHRVTLDDRPGGEGEGSKGVRVLRENSVGRGGKQVRACHVMA